MTPLSRCTAAPTLVALLFLAGERSAQDDERAQWIWASALPTDGESVSLRKTFACAAEPTSATLWISCDNRVELRLNGRIIAESDEWTQPLAVDVVGLVGNGLSELSAWCKNDGGPAGLCAELTLEFEDAERAVVATDGTWEARVDDDDAWAPVHVFGPVGIGPWGELAEPTPHLPVEALPGASVEVPAGFVVDRLHSVSRIRQGSWISLAFDDRGRLYASDQYGGLYVVSGLGAGEQVRVDEVGVELGEAHGLLWAFGGLYAVVNSSERYQSGLYHVTDVDGDGELDRAELLQALDGSGEHGPHAVVLGPEQDSLYVIAGNHTNLPELWGSLVPRLWDEHQLLPVIPDPNGHAVNRRAPGGWVCRVDRKGDDWQLVAIGLRNAYDVAFDDAGELFTFDSDMEWDVGMPWYRPARVLHVLRGADFGWRTGTGKWPAAYPDTLPAVVDVGLASPTGVEHGHATSFPAPWRDALFVADWAYGTILAVHLSHAGASYSGRTETFVSGTPLPVTDMTTGPDGALYFATGGRRTQSGLYRVRWTGAPTSTERAPLGSLSAQRRGVESLIGFGSESTAELAWPLLDSADRVERYLARTAIEHQDPKIWRAPALFESSTRASIEALLALARADPEAQPHWIVARASQWPWDELEAETAIAALRVVGLALARDREAAPPELVERWLDRHPSGDDALDRELARVLAFLDVEAFVPEALERLEAAPDQETAIHYALCLRVVRSGWNDERRALFLRWFDEVATTYEGGHSARKFLDRIRADALDAMGIEEDAATPVVAAFEPVPEAPREFVRAWTVAELEARVAEDEGPRSFERGRTIYRQAACLRCHRIAGDGGGQGPDLTGVASRFGDRDLLEALLLPSKVVSDQYVDIEIWTTDGRVHVGRIEDETAERIALRTTSGELVELAPADVGERRAHPLSRMPNGLLDVYTEDEILNLLAFLRAGGNPNDPAYEDD